MIVPQSLCSIIKDRISHFVFCTRQQEAKSEGRGSTDIRWKGPTFLLGGTGVSLAHSHLYSVIEEFAPYVER